MAVDGVKVVFLDVDGVLVCKRSLLWDFDDGDATLVHSARQDTPPMEARCLANLAAVVAADPDRTRVVISSSWRLFDTQRRFLMECLHGVGVADAVLGDTPRLGGDGGRGAEVRQWLADTDVAVAGIAVLDDGHGPSFTAAGLHARLVTTTMDKGLTVDDVPAVLAALARAPPPPAPLTTPTTPS